MVSLTASISTRNSGPTNFALHLTQHRQPRRRNSRSTNFRYSRIGRVRYGPPLPLPHRECGYISIHTRRLCGWIMGVGTPAVSAGNNASLSTPRPPARHLSSSESFISARCSRGLKPPRGWHAAAAAAYETGMSCPTNQDLSLLPRA